MWNCEKKAKKREKWANALKKLWNLVVSKPENYNLTHKTEKRLNFHSVEKRGKNSFFTNSNLQVDQIQRKIVANFNMPLFI